MKHYLILIPFFLVACHHAGTAGTEQPKDSFSQNTTDSLIDKDNDVHGIMLGTVSDKDLWLHPDKNLTSSKIGEEMTDMYNACRVMNNVFCDFDLQMRFEEFEGDVRSAIESLDLSVFNDKTTRTKVEEYKKEMLHLLDTDPSTVNQEKHSPWIARNELHDFICKRYNVDNYGKLTAEGYLERYYKNNNVKDWKKMREQRGDGKLASKLEKLYKEETDFSARCIYAIELAHAYSAGDVFDESEECNKVVPLFQDLMEEQRYSLYINEIWQLWRNLKQDSRGASKDSEIPNEEYDKMRLICANTILRYLIDHPNDIMAVNQFVVMSSHWDIFREGEFSYGNQNAMDSWTLFPERYNHSEQ